jgi:hypothetical protein
MSSSITERVHDKIEANRDAGRFCDVPSATCTSAATVKVTMDKWSPQDVLKTQVVAVMLCGRHASLVPVGHRGRNFTVTHHETY